MPSKITRRSPTRATGDVQSRAERAPAATPPRGWYDPDASTFDDVKPTDLDELLATTTPTERMPVLAISRS